jgi:hypothetical protein
MSVSRYFSIGAVICIAIAGPAFAHHSTAAYDRRKPLTVAGTVKNFHWTNPHMFIDLLVPAANGTTVEWSVECGTPNVNSRKGWKIDSVKPGDMLTIKMYPARDGSLQAQADTVILPSGKTLLAPGHDNIGPPGPNQPYPGTPGASSVPRPPEP